MNYLNPEQVTQLKEIGSNLRQRRLDLSMPEEEAAAKIHIRVGLLKALEEGQTDELPQPIFIQGLLRRYGDALGLDGDALAKTFPISFVIETADTSAQEVIVAPSSSVSKNFYMRYLLAFVAMSAVVILFYLFQRPPSSTLQRQNPPSIQ